jgi:hypothetical protein
MDTVTQISLAHPTLRQFAVGAHVVLAGWLLINGIAHQIHVLVKAHAGTLNEHANVPSLLAVGAGLLIAGAIVAVGISPLARSASPSTIPAFVGAGVLAAVVVGIAVAYGTTFLGGTIAIGVIDAALLIAHAALNGNRAAG